LVGYFPEPIGEEAGLPERSTVVDRVARRARVMPIAVGRIGFEENKP
jgi:hypothetical protein